MLCWAILASLLNILFPPRKIPADIRMFDVCMLENNQPKILHLRDFTNQTLCQQETSYTREDNPAFSFHLKQKGYEWELTEYADSLGDPLVYRYQIVNNQITPLWFSKGGMTNSILNWFFAFWVALIGYEIINSIQKRKSKKINP